MGATVVNNKSIGSPTTKSVNTVYQASTDGFLTVDLEKNATGAGTAYAYLETDASTPPTTEIGMVGDSQQDSKWNLMGMIPVKSGNYYRVRTAGSGVISARAINFTPFA